MAVSESGHTGKIILPFRCCHPVCARKYAQGAETGLTGGSWKDAAHACCDSPKHLTFRFALGIKPTKVYLVGEHPTCPVPAL